MRVLFVCHRVPFPPTQGSKIRSFNIIRHLTDRGHRVTVASLARTPAEREEASGLAQHCERAIVEVISSSVAWGRMVAWIPTTRPSSFGYFYSAGLGRRIDEELRTGQYDLVFVHSSSVAPYVRRAGQALSILDYCDVDSQKWREYAAHRRFPLAAGYWLEAVKLERVERLLSRNFDLCTCATRPEVDSLRHLGVVAPTDWFPNGVDTEFFTPAATYDRNLLVFVGRMDYYPNQQAMLSFCRDVLPGLRSRRPEVRLQIVGAEPSRQVRELAREPGVSVTGSVPDVRPYVTRAALTIAPLKIARGTQNKILESMAMGVPVVCSEAACGGVDAVAGEHLLTASGPVQYVEAIESVLGSPAQRDRLAAAGRARVLSHHSWASSMRRFDGLVESAIEQPPPRGVSIGLAGERYANQRVRIGLRRGGLGRLPGARRPRCDRRRCGSAQARTHSCQVARRSSRRASRNSPRRSSPLARSRSRTTCTRRSAIRSSPLSASARRRAPTAARISRPSSA